LKLTTVRHEERADYLRQQSYLLSRSANAIARLRYKRCRLSVLLSEDGIPYEEQMLTR